ncbi:MAG TPA: nitroreductase family deazaflavin-dependent oxidoreductase [Pseudonocardiaceae bacterium]|jgi:deazaflavin-dependent oxidoreductase (nitroreductase family)|nr:nitroreductase family deazaflavin-dependent oxidoreductase [Pseudonocardiaceae bacterium]
MSSPVAPQDSPVKWVNDHIKEYVSSGGAEGYKWRRGTEILLLTTIGRRSGTPRRTALIHREVDGNYAVVASNGGAVKHPMWYLNLVANPEVKVQVKDQEFDAVARTAEGEERARLWDLLAEVWPNYNDYQTKTDREIPIIVLEPR